MNDKQAQIEAAFAHVYTDMEKFIKVIAKEHTIANLGSSLDQLIGRSYRCEPEHLVDVCFGALASDHACEGIEIDPEYRSWLKDARRDAQKVLKAGLPLTLANARDAFEMKGPFAKKSRKK